MLYKISIENFFSIADCQELDFKIPANAPNLLCFKPSRSSNTTHLPVTVGFFGPNASGKSTILRAVVSTVLFAVTSFDWVGQINNSFQPYRQKEWWGKPTKLIFEFDGTLTDLGPSIIFRYELQIAHQANDLENKIVLYEALFYAPKGKFRRLFERNEQNFQFSRQFGVSEVNDPRTKSIRPNASVISTLAKLNHPLCAHLAKVIGTLQTNIIDTYTIHNNIEQLLAIYAQDKYCLDRLNKELRRLDIGLESMAVEQGSHGLFAKFHHVGLDDCIFFEEESSGTKRFIEIFPRIHYGLETGGVVIIDEIDTDLHPLLVPELLRWFNDPVRNIKGSQLLFTAHNPALLDELQKEQVFFTEKFSGKSTQVYGARNIRGLRRDLSLMKKYLAGELGAVPHVG